MTMRTTIAILAAALALWAEPALAKTAQEIPAWRQWWDLGWRIVNFLILAFLIYKVAKQPLLEFVRGQRDLISLDLNNIKKAKAEAEAERRALEAKIKGMAEHLKEYEANLTDLAQKQRDAILESARKEADMIIERAKLWAEQKLLQGRQQLAAEILEEAAQLAAEKLRASITPDDRARFLEDFTDSVTKKAS